MPLEIKIDREAIYDRYDTANACGLSKSAIDKAIREGELSANRRGRRTYIEGEAIYCWLTGRPQPKTEAASA